MIGRKARFGESGGKVGANWTGKWRPTMEIIAAITSVVIIGWVEYMWPAPEEMQKPKDQRVSSKKASYVLRVPGQDMFAVAGVHE